MNMAAAVWQFGAYLMVVSEVSWDIWDMCHIKRHPIHSPHSSQDGMRNVTWFSVTEAFVAPGFFLPAQAETSKDPPMLYQFYFKQSHK
jgi:hypothetical protein